MWWLSWNASRSCCSAYKLMKLRRVTAQMSLEEAAGDCLVQIPCSEQGQWGQRAQGHVDSGFRYLQGWRLHSLSAQPVPGCGHPHSNFFSLTIFMWNVLYFNVCPLFLACQWAPRRRVWVCLLYIPIKYLYTLIRSHWIFFIWTVPGFSTSLQRRDVPVH